MRIDNQMAGFRSPVNQARPQSKRPGATISGISKKRAIKAKNKNNASLPGYFGEQSSDGGPYSPARLKRAVGGLLKQNSI
jgi:hypothetical protein